MCIPNAVKCWDLGEFDVGNSKEGVKVLHEVETLRCVHILCTQMDGYMGIAVAVVAERQYYGIYSMNLEYGLLNRQFVV